MAAAYQYFERALAIQRSQSPRHLLTACLHYKIGVIQASEGQKDVAMSVPFPKQSQTIHFLTIKQREPGTSLFDLKIFQI